jgi:hypothetical protein
MNTHFEWSLHDNLQSGDFIRTGCSEIKDQKESLVKLYTSPFMGYRPLNQTPFPVFVEWVYLLSMAALLNLVIKE